MRLLAFLLPILLVGIACSGPDQEDTSTPSPAATRLATEVSPVATPTPLTDPAAAREQTALEAQLKLAPDEIRSWLESQEWVYEPSDGSLEAVASIVASALAPLRQEGVARPAVSEVKVILEAIEATSWYVDGVDSAEKARIAEVFRIDRMMRSVDPSNAFGTDSSAYFDFIGAWPEPLLAAFRGDLIETYNSIGGRQVEIVAWSKKDESAARLWLDSTTDLLPDIEHFAGPLDVTSVLLFEAPIGKPCWVAYFSLSLIEIDPSCAKQVLPFLLLGFALPQTPAVWFADGYADLVQAMLGNGVDRERLAATAGDKTFSLEWPIYLSRSDNDERYKSDVIAGYYFLVQVADIIGIDRLAALVRDLTGEPSGQVIIERIYKATPPEKQEEMLRLIQSRCLVPSGPFSLTAGKPCDPT
jgi:hypothetical protein